MCVADTPFVLLLLWVYLLFFFILLIHFAHAVAFSVDCRLLPFWSIGSFPRCNVAIVVAFCRLNMYNILCCFSFPIDFTSCVTKHLDSCSQWTISNESSWKCYRCMMKSIIRFVQPRWFIRNMWSVLCVSFSYECITSRKLRSIGICCCCRCYSVPFVRFI